MVPVLRFSRTSRGSCRKQNASSEQVKAGVARFVAADGAVLTTPEK